MIRLYRNIILFFLPILILVVFLPVNERSKFLGLKDDCFNHGIWIHDRIYTNNKPIDIAFFGTSKTINGINDKLIEEQLSEFKINVLNLGYCRLGRNFSFSILKKMVENKYPTQLIIEIREDENRYSHPNFPYIASTNEVIFAYPFFNRDLLSDMVTHFSYKIELTQDLLYDKIPEVPVNQKFFGYACSPDTASIEFLNNIAGDRQQPKPVMKKMGRDFYMQFSRAYLEKIYNLSSRENIEVTFLYIPSYGSPNMEPKELETYKQYGEILYLPKEIFENPDNWYDEDHLNQAGAEKLSLWISEQLATIYK